MRKNKKINGFENMIIKKALLQYCDAWVKDIQCSEGNWIFHETYPDLVFDQISDKIDSLTYKNDLK